MSDCGNEWLKTKISSGIANEQRFYKVKKRKASVG